MKKRNLNITYILATSFLVIGLSASHLPEAILPEGILPAAILPAAFPSGDGSVLAADQVLVGVGSDLADNGSTGGAAFSSGNSAPVLGDADYNGGLTVLGSSSPLTVEDTLDEYEWVKTNMAGRFMPYVITHAEGNPNVIHFLYEYGHDAKSPDTFEYTEEEKSSGIPLLMQWDWRWGYFWYGGGPAGLTGCAPTCMTMIGLGLTGDESYTVPAMCQYAIDKGYWVDGQGTSWSLVTDAFPNDPIVCQNISVDEGSIAAAIRSGCPVLINVGIGKFSAVGHFMVLSGLDSDGNFILNDPNNLENSSKSWAWSDLVSEIQAAWSYSLQST